MIQPIDLRSRAAKLLGVYEHSAVFQRAVDLSEQRPLLVVAQMMNRERRHDRVVLVVDPPGAVVADLELKTLAAELKAFAGAIEHLVRDINHRDPRARKAVGDKRRKQSGAGAQVENFYLGVARKT